MATAAAPAANAGTASWSSGLCGGGLADPITCAATCCLPCWAIPRTMSAMDGRTCEGHFLSQLILNACCCLGLVQKAKVRSDYRSSHGIAGSAVSDLLLTICCLPCATCQEASDVSLRRGQPVVPFAKGAVDAAAAAAAAVPATTAPAVQVMETAAEQAESGAAKAAAAVKPSKKK
jgi:Cys-rich protein (TIGR01571 family)